jgi:DNA polymerase III epsilon subunit-like protein
MYTDWEKQAHNTYVLDIETDDLDASVIWVMCWRNVGTKETGDCIGHEEISEWFEKRHNERNIYVGHNILKFDSPTLRRICGSPITSNQCIDTLVLSTLYNPSIDGGHSLDAWGQRMGNDKIDFNDWSKLSEEMITYCRKDVEITCQLYQRLMKTLLRLNFTEGSIWLQHRLTEILDEQRKNGFEFDGPRAINLYSFLRSREEELENEIRQAFPANRVQVAERSMFRKDKEPTAIYLRDKERYILDCDEQRGTYRAFEDVEFNVGSPKQRS